MQHRKPPHSQASRRRTSAGFTLVELMVGLVLGLLTTLVISEVLVLTEGKKRTLTMGGDAQVNGALSLYTIQRDVQMAGYGAVINPNALGCPVKGEYKDPAAPTGPGAAFTPTLAPVVIDNGTDGAPDTITILQSRKSSFSAPILVASDHSQTSEFFVVKSSFGAAAGDLMIAVPKDGLWSVDKWCAVFSVTDDGSSSPTDTTLGFKRVPHVAGGNNAWNRSSVFPDDGYEKDSYLLNMGTMSHNTYAIDSAHNLGVTARTAEAATTSATPLYPQIVNLQAMYGKDTTLDGQVDTYDTETPTTALGWQQVLAIRIALVARSGQYEKEEVTNADPLWDVGANSTIAGTETCHGASKCLKLKIDHVADWKHYRYKVFDTVVPLRNVLWNSAGIP